MADNTARPAAVASGFPDKRPSLVHGSLGRQARQQLGPTTERGQRETAPDDLAEAPQIGNDPEPLGGATRAQPKTVITSSKISSAPAASQAARHPAKNPSAGHTRFMLAATGSTMTQATRSSTSGTTL